MGTSTSTNTKKRRPRRPRRPIYLDYAATTPVDPRVAAELKKFLDPRGVFGNPASRTHRFGNEAAHAVAHARAQVAVLIGAQPHEIIWTSGATEATNLAIKGAAHAHKSDGNHIITSKLEHKAVLDTCAALEKEGFALTYLDPDANGLITSALVRAALRKSTILVSLMHVNNEVGTITDIAQIGALVRSHGAIFHVDAAQSIARLPFDVEKQNIDLASLSGHKIYAPKGVGALYVRNRPQVKLQPLIHGGGHERGLRSGTLPTHQIAALGEAARILTDEREQNMQQMASLDKEFLAGLKSTRSWNLNGNQKNRVAGILNLHFSNATSESLIVALSDLAFSSGSACTSAEVEPSHVLKALGVPAAEAECSIRVSLGRFSSAEEVKYAQESLGKAVDSLREIAKL